MVTGELTGAGVGRLYDADPKVLKAFANTGVEFIISIGNEYLSKMSGDPKQAQAWVKANVQPFIPATKISCIAVGNEVLTLNDTALSACLLPVMQNVYAALAELNLHNQISVTTAHNLAVLQTSYPPSAGRFRPDLVSCLTGILNFHVKTDSPFLIEPVRNCRASQNTGERRKATNTSRRFSWGLGMPIVGKSDLSTGNSAHASYLIRSGELDASTDLGNRD